jgi:hypothetical protein
LYFLFFNPRVDTRSTPDPQEGFGKEEPELNSTSASVRDYPHSWKTYLGWRNHLLRGKNCLLRSRRRRRRNLAPEEVREDGGKGISHNVFFVV